MNTMNTMNTIHDTIHDGKLEEIVKIINSSCDLNILDNKGRSALHNAVKNDKYDIVKLLLKHGAIIDVNHFHPLIHAIYIKNNFKMVKLLIKYKANVNITTVGEFTPLFKAIHSHNNIIAKLLIQNGAYINVPNSSNQPLTVAAMTGSIEMVKYLIDKGANVYHTDDDNYTALHYAMLYNRLDIAELLMSYLPTESSIDDVVANVYSMNDDMLMIVNNMKDAITKRKNIKSATKF